MDQEEGRLMEHVGNGEVSRGGAGIHKGMGPMVSF